jgi:hypothetical protein
MFYAVERFVDGFGADTWVDCIFKNEDDARKYIEKLKKENPNVDAEVITCKFGKPILQYYG